MDESTRAARTTESETTGPVRMPDTMRRRRGCRYHDSPAAAHFATEALRVFRQATDGWSGRLRMRSLGAQRAGRVRCAQVAIAEFLVSARAAGCTRAWAEQYAVGFVVGLVDQLWADALPPEGYALEREQVAEGQENVATLRYLANPTAAERQRLVDLLELEQAATRVLLADLRRQQRSQP